MAKKKIISTIKRYPLTLERKYQRTLTRSISDLLNILKKKLFPQLKLLKNNSKNQLSKFDSIEDDLDDIFNTIEEEFNNAYPREKIKAIAAKHAGFISEQNLLLLQAQIKQVQGIDLFIAERGIKTQVNMFIRQNVSLIETVHKSYFKDVQTIVFQGVGKGEPTSLMTEKIMKRTGVTKNRAKLIARDQTSKLNGNITAERHTSLGIKKFRWATSLDERVRDSHAAVEGQIFSYKTGASIDGESNVLPGEPINCRCVGLPVFEK